ACRRRGCLCDMEPAWKSPVLTDRLNLPDLERAVAAAGRRNLTIVTAESCTAGKLSALLSEAPGAAEHLHGSFVTYTKANKVEALWSAVPCDHYAGSQRNTSAPTLGISPRDL